ncbi:MAG: hypothetical protein K2O14_07505, partial [Oscillospiraceae bacterium]|nr:hypothetical protein [Oscillospiraceae bacterium]
RVDRYEEVEENGTKFAPTGLNAGTYHTRVYITKLNDSYNFEDRSFDITWEITKAIFDLTDVKWDCSGEVGYTGKPIKVQLLNVPSQLTATYSNNVEMSVNQGSGTYTSRVSFKPRNEAEKDNYAIPSGDLTSGTYIYNVEGETSFPWVLTWRIVKGTISDNWDLDGKEATGANNYQYTYPTLLDGGDNVEYKLYKEIDGAKATNPTAFADVVKPADKEKDWYYVVATLTGSASNNYKFTNDATSVELRFAIGDYRDPVNVTYTSGDSMYDGKPHPIEFTFDALSRADFVVTYLDADGVVLSGAPSDAGTYTARLAIREDKADSYYIVGRSHTFTIEKFHIDPADLKWDYTVPFQFVREGGAERTYTVKLANVPI